MQPGSHPILRPKVHYPRVRVKLLKGIRLLPLRPERPNPYGVVWSSEGKRLSAYFPSGELLEKKLVELNEARRQGTISLIPTRHEIQEWRVFRAAAGTVRPMEIFAGWQAWCQASGRPICDLLCDKAVTDYLAEQ